MSAKSTGIPPVCIVSAGVAGALAQAAGFVFAVLLLQANLVWGNGRDLHVCLSSTAIGFLAVFIPVLLLRIRYRVSGSQSGMIAVFCVVTSPVLLVVAAIAVDVVKTGVASLEAGLWAILLSAFMVLPGLPGAVFGAWAGSQTAKGRGASV